MLTHYQVTRPRKIKVRVVKPHAHVRFLNTPNVVDTRQPAKRGFGRAFFLSLNEKEASEHDAWHKLEKRLRKRIS
ncbi:hypothetical protein HYX70_03140 [Candidatus Saccharibacteria bacterium]|nr:hypothetical protein [Candidatus Saccharibacteria bacterium]